MIQLRSLPCRKLVTFSYLCSLDCFAVGQLSSSAGATEGKLGSAMKLYVEDTVKLSGQLELVQDQADAKIIASALATGCELSLLPFCHPLVDGWWWCEVCLLPWLATNSARKTSCGASWVSLLVCLKSNW